MSGSRSRRARAAVAVAVLAAGACGPGGDGALCSDDADCEHACIQGVCGTAEGVACVAQGDCPSDLSCETWPEGQLCTKPCDDNADCSTATCTDIGCQPPPRGSGPGGTLPGGPDCPYCPSAPPQCGGSQIVYDTCGGPACLIKNGHCCPLGQPLMVGGQCYGDAYAAAEAMCSTGQCPISGCCAN